MKMSLDLFRILMSNGVMLDAMLDEYGEDAMKSVLVEYVNEMNNESDEDLKSEFLFYEEEDEVVLRKLGFENLIAE